MALSAFWPIFDGFLGYLSYKKTHIFGFILLFGRYFDGFRAIKVTKRPKIWLYWLFGRYFDGFLDY